MKRAYIIKTSIGQDVQIDEEELPKALKTWADGNIEQFRQGFVRGDLIGLVVVDSARMKTVESVFNHKTGQREGGELKPLPDIFKGKILLLEGKDSVKLN